MAPRKHTAWLVFQGFQEEALYLRAFLQDYFGTVTLDKHGKALWGMSATLTRGQFRQAKEELVELWGSGEAGTYAPWFFGLYDQNGRLVNKLSANMTTRQERAYARYAPEQLPAPLKRTRADNRRRGQLAEADDPDDVRLLKNPAGAMRINRGPIPGGGGGGGGGMPPYWAVMKFHGSEQARQRMAGVLMFLFEAPVKTHPNADGTVLLSVPSTEDLFHQSIPFLDTLVRNEPEAAACQWIFGLYRANDKQVVVWTEHPIGFSQKSAGRRERAVARASRYATIYGDSPMILHHPAPRKHPRSPDAARRVAKYVAEFKAAGVKRTPRRVRGKAKKTPRKRNPGNPRYAITFIFDPRVGNQLQSVLLYALGDADGGGDLPDGDASYQMWLLDVDKDVAEQLFAAACRSVNSYGVDPAFYRAVLTNKQRRTLRVCGAPLEPQRVNSSALVGRQLLPAGTSGCTMVSSDYMVCSDVAQRENGNEWPVDPAVVDAARFLVWRNAERLHGGSSRVPSMIHAIKNVPVLYAGWLQTVGLAQETRTGGPLGEVTHNVYVTTRPLTARQLQTVVVHELCHVAIAVLGLDGSRRLTPLRSKPWDGHGPEWRRLMEQCGEDPLLFSSFRSNPAATLPTL